MAVSMLSARRGWLQQLLDQYSGHSRLVAARCCSSSSPLGVENEQRESPVQNSRPAWHWLAVQMADLAVRLVHEYQRL